MSKKLHDVGAVSALASHSFSSASANEVSAPSSAVIPSLLIYPKPAADEDSRVRWMETETVNALWRCQLKSKAARPSISLSCLHCGFVKILQPSRAKPKSVRN